MDGLGEDEEFWGRSTSLSVWTVVRRRGCTGDRPTGRERDGPVEKVGGSLTWRGRGRWKVVMSGSSVQMGGPTRGSGIPV